MTKHNKHNTYDETQHNKSHDETCATPQNTVKKRYMTKTITKIIWQNTTQLITYDETQTIHKKTHDKTCTTPQNSKKKRYD